MRYLLLLILFTFSQHAKCQNSIDHLNELSYLLKSSTNETIDYQKLAGVARMAIISLENEHPSITKQLQTSNKTLNKSDIEVIGIYIYLHELLAKFYFLSYDFKSVINISNKIINLKDLYFEYSSDINFYLILGNSYKYIGEYNSALSSYEKIFTLPNIREIASEDFLFRTRLEISKVTYLQGNISIAFSQLRSITFDFQNTKNDALLILNYHDLLGIMHLKLGDYVSAEYQLNMAYEIGKTHKLYPALIPVLIHLEELYISAEMYDQVKAQSEMRQDFVNLLKVSDEEIISFLELFSDAENSSLNSELERSKNTFSNLKAYYPFLFEEFMISDFNNFLLFVGNREFASGKFLEGGNLIFEAIKRQVAERKPLTFDFLHSVFTILKILYNRGDKEVSMDLYINAFLDINDILNYYQLNLDERSNNLLVNNILSNFIDLIYTISLDLKDDHKIFTEIVYNNEILRKEGISASENSKRKFIQNVNDSLLYSLLENLQILRNHLAELYEVPNKENLIEAWKTENVISMSESLISSYLKNIYNFESEIIDSSNNWHNVQKSLLSNEAAIEFFYYKDVTKKEAQTYYGAAILLPSYDHPKLFKLFEENELKKFIDNPLYRTSEYYINQLYNKDQNGSQIENADLFNMLFGPYFNLISGAKKLHIAPAGILNNIAFHAIPIKDSLLLSDYFTVSIYGSTRNIINRPNPYLNLNQNDYIALFGGIKYDAIETDSLSVGFKRSSDYLYYKDFGSKSDSNRGSYWSDLPATLKEVDMINSLFSKYNRNSQIFVGRNATEESFKNLSKANISPKIIHIATHGFYSDNKLYSDISFDKNDQTFINRPLLKNLLLMNNPSTRSGIIFAGANNAWYNGIRVKGKDDGILNALEVSNLDFTNTQLVTLSACETGLGVNSGHEGQIGLRRSFKTSGVDFLIVSLWQVPDAQTSELMIKFYTNWLSGIPIQDAFLNAQKEMRSKYSIFNWGAFELIQ